jgi:restriction system protein
LGFFKIKAGLLSEWPCSPTLLVAAQIFAKGGAFCIFKRKLAEPSQRLGNQAQAWFSLRKLKFPNNSNIKMTLTDAIVEKIRNVSPSFFERMGYGGSIKDAGNAAGKTNDEEIDGIIKEDKLCLDVIDIQAKRWK